MRKEVMEVENGTNPYPSDLYDDDGRLKRTGTVWTAFAHVITGVIGAGVLSLAWAMSQLGWFLGILSIVLFSAITLYTANLLADCYRSPNPVTGKRNTTYMDAVQVHLGGKMHVYCGVVQYGMLAGYGIGYTITTALSVVTILKNGCMAKNGIEAPCRYSFNPYMISMGIIEIIFSQIPNFHELAWLSVLAAIMSFAYSFIGVGLSIATVIQGKGVKTYLFWNTQKHVTGEDIWNKLAALGNIALASAIAQISIDIQDSLKSSPAENKVMKKANVIAISTMTLIFLLSSCAGYAAFGPDTPPNILMSTGFHKPVWLVDLANIFIIVHLIGAYQVLIQPFYHIVEILASKRWPNSSFITKEYPVKIGKMRTSMNLFRLVWRTTFVVLATVLAMALPFFNYMLSLLGAIGFWPSTIYFPVEMYIVRKKIRKGSLRWIGLQTLSLVCFLVSLIAACGAIEGLSKAVGKYKPFMYKE
ncbi:hypothetical protein Lal_00019995 [Lupinus albus]|uniref:Putative amino acid transporter, transmembrane domain-containing protein n=1 Tax=Lupinus albus TaxID=3870 RepID=A0A6A5MGV3_LUPAL|nr:putative amino acid transporter, transmembrane domain-containing protein [Lupinus albus]KAF1871203.1 hypothetical protein Lal_00019995 [Lupinus albus]